KNITDIGGSIADITLKEDVVGALEANGADFTKEKTIKLVLSPGFTWDRVELSRYGGFSEIGINILRDIVTERDGRSTLYLGINNKTGKNPGELVIRATVKTSGNLTSARDVKVTYGGTNPGVGGERIAEVTVAKYLVPGLTSAAKSTLDVVAGRKNQFIGSFTVAEGMTGDLPAGRVIRLTLPEGAKWNNHPAVVREAGNGKLAAKPTVHDNGRTLTYAVDQTGTSRTTFAFKNGTVDLALTAPEELTVAVKGPSMEQSFTVANVQVPLTLSSGGGTLKIGEQMQRVEDLTIQENLPGALRARDAAGNRAVLKLTLPQGVRFAKTPVVKVADGDLELAASGGGLLDNNRTLVIPVELSSATPVEKKPSGNQSNNGAEAIAELVGSIIEVRDIFLTLDRSVPEGEITLEVSGSALSETEGLFALSDNQLTWVLARCGTPAQDAAKKEAVFTIGSNKYFIGGEEREMDVEPYIKGGRTYAPVRYLAYAAGLNEDNILWDGQKGVVTILAGNRTIQFKLGEKSYLIQGMAISIDAAPEIVSGRTMLPYRFVAQALGLQAQWDEAARQVVVR
ncbi:MAG: copper amine oxidase N-terminal domain-containing protein, partial [Eubacteriales bacterium]|nr:copper amine oxidase N-terminal domain-containing protein [Eubacteriales bacterium]